MGVLDIIRSDETGILVDENEDDFAKACNRLLENRAEREKLGRNAQKWACSESACMSTHKLLDIYHDACKNQSATRTILDSSIP
jgi:glycosyltransferase involved in cell wall biosynthesis